MPVTTYIIRYPEIFYSITVMKKNKAEDIVDPTQLNISEARPNNKSRPLRSTNGTLADFNSNFENEPDPGIEKMNQDCCENNKQEHKNKEENEPGKEEQGEGHRAEDGSQSTHRHPEASAGAAAVTLQSLWPRISVRRKLPQGTLRRMSRSSAEMTGPRLEHVAALHLCVS